ncbi:DUF2442 domain-containing protein [Candidatus Poribacteria bacterium]|nr:DUF2442 domain-containing protein [Candidatus Poribacteria bacterium]
MKPYHHVTNVQFEGELLHVTIAGHAKTFNIREISPVLLHASEHERQTFEISPSGYGIHWPLLDEDLSIDGLLGIVHTPPKKVKSA